jgi:hypothetical protein
LFILNTSRKLVNQSSATNWRNTRLGNIFQVRFLQL